MFSGGGMTRRAWEVPSDAGAMPRTTSVLAAIHSLVNRASAPDGGVRKFNYFQYLVLSETQLTHKITDRNAEKSDYVWVVGWSAVWDCNTH
jgi:hypothetical protein